MPRRSVTSIDSYIGQRLSEIREARGVSRDEVGAFLGIAYQQVQKYEKGANRISATTLLKLAEFFDVPLDFFFAGVSKTSSQALKGIPTQEFLPSDVAELVASYRAISNTKLRRQVLEFVKMLANLKRE